MNTLTTDAPFMSLPVPHADVQARAQELARRFAQRHREVRLHPFEHRELHPELWGEISANGWPGLLVPAEHGGTEGGLLAYLLVMEALAASNLILWMPVGSSESASRMSAIMQGALSIPKSQCG